MKKLKLTVIIACMYVTGILAQDTIQTERNLANVSKTSGSRFLLTGYGFTGFEMKQMTNESESTFGQTGFSPIFLYKPSAKLFFESELEFELEGNEVNLELEYANVSYLMNKYMTVRMGKFLSPFGTFQERLHPAWINKFADKPLGFGHDAVGPGTEVGVELRGGIPLGPSKMKYSLYISNGPTLNTGQTDSMMAGALEYDNFEDNNLNKAIGGRLGILPFSNSSLEIGLSGQMATVGTAKDPDYKDTKATMLAGDFSYVKPLKFMKSNLDIKAQYSQVSVDKKNYADPMDTTGMLGYTFDNVSSAYYVQVAIRPAMLVNNFLSKIELVGRYSSLTLPEGAKWEEQETQTSIGLNYWLTWRSVIKFNYQINQISDGHEDESVTNYRIQWAIGF